MGELGELDQAIDADAYTWFTQQTFGPTYITAIERELQKGATPEAVRYYVQARVGPERAGLALRCEQAARHIQRMGE